MIMTYLTFVLNHSLCGWKKYILSFVSPNLTFILLRKMVMIGHINMVFFSLWSVRIVCLILLFVDLVISRS